MKKIKAEKGRPLYAFMLVLFCFASVVGTALYFFNKSFKNMEHERKWGDYDDCGII